VLQYDGVQTDWMLSIHTTVNNLQHRSVEGCGVIKAKDVALDPSSNAMNVAKHGLALRLRSNCVHRTPIIVM